MALTESKPFIDWVFEHRASWIGCALSARSPDDHIALLDVAVAMYCEKRDDLVYEDALAIRDFQLWQYDRLNYRPTRLMMGDDLVDEYLKERPAYASFRSVVAYWAIKVSEARCA